jgi:hypothetical protein
MKPIAILYEHPEWFRPLFAVLERRSIRFEKLHIEDLHYDPSQGESPYSLIVNRVSAYPSAGTHPEIVLFTKHYLAYLDSIGAAVLNGYDSYVLGASKAAQLDLLEKLGLRYPRARVIHHPDQALAAAAGLAFPLVFKPNVGGSGAAILKFEDKEESASTVQADALDLGIDHTGLVQEYLLPRDREIVRVEILDGEYLYAIRLPISNESFNYCPADGCNIDRPDLAVQPHQPPEWVIQDVKRILAASSADLGSVEYLISEADGEVYYYDINPLSNFVADAPRILGFDPFERLADLIEERAKSQREVL